MQKHILLFVALLSMAGVNAQYNLDNLSVKQVNDLNLVTYKNLRIFPIRAGDGFFRAHSDVGKYMPLAKALESGKVVITEVIDSSRTTARQEDFLNNAVQNQAVQVQSTGISDGQVNKLYIENSSPDTVLILAGEVVKGGKQDRVIAQDVILYPKSGKQDLSVFCVERGRWQPRSSGSNTGGVQMDAYMFNAVQGVSSVKVRRKAAVSKNQQEVWDEVGNVTTQNNAQSSTGTYTALDSTTEYRNEIKGYLDFFTGLLMNDPSVIGIVACTGDEILACDMFATHTIFSQQLPGLLKSYATEAMTSGEKATVSYDRTRIYMEKILKDEAAQEPLIKENGTMVKDKRGNKLHLSYY